jgi:hypothetical protein
MNGIYVKQKGHSPFFIRTLVNQVGVTPMYHQGCLNKYYFRMYATNHVR